MVAEHEKRPLFVFYCGFIGFNAVYQTGQSHQHGDIRAIQPHIYSSVFLLFFHKCLQSDIPEPGRTRANIFKYLQIFIIIYVFKKINGVFA